MNGWLDSFYMFISGAALLFAVLGIWFTVVMPGIDRWSKRFFLGFFTVIMLSCLSGLVEMALSPYAVPSAAIKLLLVLESLFLLAPLPMMTAYLLHCCGENPRKSRLFHAVLGLWTVHFVLLASSLFTDAFYCVTPEKQYYRGSLFPLQQLPIAMILLLNLGCTIRHRKLLSHKAFLSFLVALIPMTVTLFVDLFVEIYPLVIICCAFSALSMYSLILSDQVEQSLRQQQEIAQQRASIMVLQMRPHFIYNTMTSIYCLCSRDPEKAQQVVMDFTTYLRKNFTAVASASPIPFASELEHTRAYLDVELALFSKSLSVDYDTPHTFFRLPPLTLQPIVENAVKHGRDPDLSPLHISIRTRKTESGSEITVLDNGRGFDPDDNSDPGIAIKNIRQRLEMMCGGSLTITPNEGGGTVVTVTIPNSAAP